MSLGPFFLVNNNVFGEISKLFLLQEMRSYIIYIQFYFHLIMNYEFNSIIKIELECVTHALEKIERLKIKNTVLPINMVIITSIQSNNAKKCLC